MNITTLDQAVELFARDGMPARNLAAHTRKNYLLDLTDLVQFLAGRRVTRIADVSLRHLLSGALTPNISAQLPCARQRRSCE